MDEKFREEMREYVWKYFALHADQRIKTFNFYLVLCTLIVGGLITLLKDSQKPFPATLVEIGLTFISFIFWRLDIRNKELIHHSEETLKLLEIDDRIVDEEPNIPNRMKIFSHEEFLTKELKKNKKRFFGIFPRHYSYTTCFNAVFLGLGSAVWLREEFYLFIAPWVGPKIVVVFIRVRCEKVTEFGLRRLFLGVK